MTEAAARAGQTAAIALAVATLARHYRYQGATPAAIATFREELSTRLEAAAANAERRYVRDHGPDIDWQRVALKLALSEGVVFRRLTTKEAEALRALVDAERERVEHEADVVAERTADAAGGDRR